MVVAEKLALGCAATFVGRLQGGLLDVLDEVGNLVVVEGLGLARNRIEDESVDYDMSLP